MLTNTEIYKFRNRKFYRRFGCPIAQRSLKKTNLTLTDMSICSKCQDDVLAEDMLSCSVCNVALHFGRGALAETTFRKMSKERKKKWNCSDCKNKVSVLPTTSEESSDDDLYQRHKKVFQESLNASAKEVQNKLTDFESSLNFNFSQLDQVLTGFAEMKTNLAKLQAKQDALEKENILLKKTIKEIKSGFQIMEQKSLVQNLEIAGLPDTVDTRVIIPSLCTRGNIPLPDENSYAVKRPATGTQSRPKPIIVSFKNQELRDTLLKKSTQLRPKVSDITGKTGDDGAVFVNEQLTPQLKQLFYHAKKTQKEKGFAFLWVTEGKILLKNTTESKAKRVYDIDDLNM